MLSAPSAFDGLRIERVALISHVVYPCQVQLVTSCARSVRSRVRFKRRSSIVSFKQLTDLFMFMKVLAL